MESTREELRHQTVGILRAKNFPLKVVLGAVRHVCLLIHVLWPIYQPLNAQRSSWKSNTNSKVSHSLDRCLDFLRWHLPVHRWNHGVRERQHGKFDSHFHFHRVTRHQKSLCGLKYTIRRIPPTLRWSSSDQVAEFQWMVEQPILGMAFYFDCKAFDLYQWIESRI